MRRHFGGTDGRRGDGQSVPRVRIPLAPPARPRARVLRPNLSAIKPRGRGHFQFGLWTPYSHKRPTILRTAHFSPNLWTPPVRYGSRNSNVWSYLLTSAKRGSATSLRRREALISNSPAKKGWVKTIRLILITKYFRRSSEHRTKNFHLFSVLPKPCPRLRAT
jgi:hypothetical protein